MRAGRVRIDCVCLRFQFGRLDVSDGDSLHLGFVLICESVADDWGTQSALRASKARVTGGVLRVGRQLPSASRRVPCGAERKLIGHFPLSVAEQRLCVPKHAAPLLRRSEASRIRRWWGHCPSAARPSGETGRLAAPGVNPNIRTPKHPNIRGGGDAAPAWVVRRTRCAWLICGIIFRGE